MKLRSAIGQEVSGIRMMTLYFVQITDNRIVYPVPGRVYVRATEAAFCGLMKEAQKVGRLEQLGS